MIYDVIDYIQGRVPLGSAIACPFHDDHNASATVMQESGRIWCYRCQVSTDQVQAAAKLWFSDVEESLAYGMATALIEARQWPLITRAQPSPQPLTPEDPRLFEVMTAWCRLTCANLRTYPQIIAQITRTRGVDHPIALGIGLAAPQLFEPFLRDLGPQLAQEDLLVASGLIYPDDGTPITKRYRLGDRLTLPEIRHEPEPRVIHLQARAQEREARIRYLNPRGVHRPIYGWESLERPRPYIWMVEGVFDLYPLLEGGEAAVSVNGVGFDPRQLEGFKAKVGMRPVLVAFDNDPPHPVTGERPGLTAAVKRVEMLLAEGIAAKRFLPPDPYKDIGEWIVAKGRDHVIAIAEWDTT